MNLTINGETTQVDGVNTVAELLQQRETDADSVAVALNHELVPRQDYTQTPLKEGDDVEIVAPMQGG
jgi:sulfur carrier protein